MRKIIAATILSLSVILVAVRHAPAPTNRSAPAASTAAAGTDLFAPYVYNLVWATDDVEARAVWELPDAHGTGLTGKGIVVCDIDSHVDVFHPMFFRADGGRFDWIDVDGNGEWSPGDAVDLDADGLAGSDEALGWLRAEGFDDPDQDTTRFRAGYDFLYQDANRNGIRDYGARLFTEQDPCYGERFFVVDDANGNERLDVGEELVGLKTSKIRAINSGRIYRRGVDLIKYPESTSDTHGTAVCGVLAGGWPRLHKLTGVAPDLEILVAHGRGEGSLLWAQNEGADVILYESGGRLPSDGSDSFEYRVDELCRNGFIFAAAAGNARGTLQHVVMREGEPATLDVGQENWGFVSLDVVWRGSSPSILRFTLPDGAVVDLSVGDYEEVEKNGYVVYAEVESESLAGTKFLSCGGGEYRDSGVSVAGSWQLSLPGWGGTAHV